MAMEVEVLVNGDGRVMIAMAALNAAPVSYKTLDHAGMTFELVCDDGSRHSFCFPEEARDGWQKVVDNEEMLVTEVSSDESLEAYMNIMAKPELSREDLPGVSDEQREQLMAMLQQAIVRDEWLKPEDVA